MIRRLLVANRGEIAVRIIRACREMSIEPVAVFSEADRNALHVQMAAQAVCIGPAPAPESYLNQESIVAAAKLTRVDAVHPGYGFLAENPAFAERCRSEGMIFVGPSSEAIRAMGDKAKAKQLARAAGIACVPGYDGEDQSDAALRSAATATGYPLLIKPAAGGGGKGMHIVERQRELRRLLAQSRREALQAFGDQRLMLERLILRPRHIEVQLLGDEHGSLIALGERECSIQRRYQKIIEEAPSPAVDDALRHRLMDMALAVARAAGYTNAGTVEFLLDQDGNTYFLEMNTRLQVEHGVSEAVYGVDLVRSQIELAAGQRLRLAQRDLQPRGHAIECRVYAEDPAAGFLPSTGQLLAFRAPEGPGIRHDVGTYEGDTIGPYYDPLLAKLIVHAPNRGAAIERLRSALSAYSVLGVQTNLALLQRVSNHPDFELGQFDIGFLMREPQLVERDPCPPPIVLFGATAADILESSGDQHKGGDLGRAGGWRMGQQGLTFRWECSGESYLATADRDPMVSGGWRLRSGETELSAQISRGEPGTVTLRAGTHVERLDIGRDRRDVWVGHRGAAWRLSRPQPPSLSRRQRGAEGGTSRALVSPLPGRIARVEVQVGQEVSAHQVLVILEAMKMEHAIEARSPGIVRRLHVSPGDQVSVGAPLAELDEA